MFLVLIGGRFQRHGTLQTLALQSWSSDKATPTGPTISMLLRLTAMVRIMKMEVLLKQD
jgi:hypothetical protein